MTTSPHGFTSATPLKGIIFDIDGVLFNSSAVNIGYYNLLRSTVDLPPMSAEDEVYCQMSSAKEAFERIIPEPLRLKGFAATKTHPYAEYAIPRLSLAEGLLPLITWLKEKSILMGVCTNRSSQVEEFFANFGIDGFFDPIKTAACCAPKPSPQGLTETCIEWKAPPQSVVFVGDSQVDEQASRAAGVPFWAFDNQSLGADLHIPDFFAMKSAIKNIFVQQDA